jgi:hypothetical protein
LLCAEQMFGREIDFQFARHSCVALGSSSLCH